MATKSKEKKPATPPDLDPRAISDAIEARNRAIDYRKQCVEDARKRLANEQADLEALETERINAATLIRHLLGIDKAPPAKPSRSKTAATMKKPAGTPAKKNAKTRPAKKAAKRSVKKTSRPKASAAVKSRPASTPARKVTKRDPDRDPPSGVSPEDWNEAQALVAAKPAEYAALRKKLRKAPSTSSILKNLRDATPPAAKPLDSIVAILRGPDASKAKGKKTGADKPLGSLDLDPDFDAAEIAATASTKKTAPKGLELPELGASRNGKSGTSRARSKPPAKDKRRRLATV